MRVKRFFLSIYVIALMLQESQAREEIPHEAREPISHDPLLTATLDAPCRDVQHELSHLVTARLVALDQEIAELYHLREELACCQQQLTSGVVEKDEPFITCYDQACLACSPSPVPAQAPVTVLPRRHPAAVTPQANGW